MAELYILIVPVLLFWGLSILWLHKWKKFWFFFGVNSIVLSAYLTYLFFAPLKFIGHDEYGIRQMALIYLVLWIHVLCVFIYAIYRRFIYKKDIRKPFEYRIRI